jgi:hypothetical protein
MRQTRPASSLSSSLSYIGVDPLIVSSSMTGRLPALQSSQNPRSLRASERWNHCPRNVKRGFIRMRYCQKYSFAAEQLGLAVLCVNWQSQR